MQRARFGSLVLVIAALPALAQQSGSLAGKLTARGGAALAGVRVQAASGVLPTPRTTVSGENGEFRLPFLPPGDYTLLFTQAGRKTEKVSVQVLLQQTTLLNLVLADADLQGAVVEVVGQGGLLDPVSGELRTALPGAALESLPIGLDYRGLVALMPSVPYTQDTVRAPNAGGSGQDNVHYFDGVNVNMPMYGTASSEPSTHDIDQASLSKGGAAAMDFNRSAGYTLNTISKSGTDVVAGELAYQMAPISLIARQKNATGTVYDDGRTYTNGSLGGPILKEKLFYFFSYFRPTDSRDNASNAYGPMPSYRNDRDEYFGKLTYAPTPDLLLHASHRNSIRTYQNQGVGGVAYAPSTSDGGRVTLAITSLEAAWTLGHDSYLNLKASDFRNDNADRPDHPSQAKTALDGSATLNIHDLAGQGEFAVPLPAAATAAGAAAFNAAIAPYIAAYGFVQNGVPTGGGFVGGYPLTSNQNFFRRSYQAAFDTVLGQAVTHDLHVGFQWYRDSEDLNRLSNGWGVIGMPINVLTPNTRQAATFVAALQQQGIGVPTIHSEFLSENLELNDRIHWQAFTFNVGAMASRDRTYGQGLREDPSTLSGYAAAPGNRYLEHEVPFSQTLQPRLGATWNYHGQDTVYFNYARFVPATNSLARGSSWARNLIATVNVYFDANGRYLDKATETSSTGKLYVPGIRPRHTDEYLLGTSRDLGSGLTGRLFARYRYSCNFWEDTRNDSRTLFQPPAGIPQTLYIPNLPAQLTQLGVPLDPKFPNNQYVIAQLDGAFTKYYQAALELEWRNAIAFASFSYSWSHYYGNFDQDNTTTARSNDSNIFVSSSNLSDDAGKQVWDNKYGNLTGDRRHQVKLYGTCLVPWGGKVGIFAFYQSGQPWQYSSYTPYLALITASGSTSRSDTDRYMEPAGSRRTAPHYQMDLCYTQAFWKYRTLSLSGLLDVFNVFNRQTGYAIQSSVHLANPGVPQTYFAPRRTQVGLKFTF
jgi:hypothetical protein